MFWRVAKHLAIMVVVIFMMTSTSYALGAMPVISHLKTGESGAASAEFVAIYNNSSDNIDITNWCLYYSSASDVTKSKIACLEPPNENTTLVLEPFSYVRFSSAEFSSMIENFQPDFEFTVGLSGTSGHIRLLNSVGEEIDKIGYGAAVGPESEAVAVHSSGNFLIRKKITDTDFMQDLNNNALDFVDDILAEIPASGLFEIDNSIDFCPNIDGFQIDLPDGMGVDENGNCIEDVCPNLDGLQLAVPEGYVLDGQSCLEDILSLESSVLLITELLPNASGVDTGQEFIEIYNPNKTQVNLKNYKLSLGPAFTKNYTFAEQILDPFAYTSFSDILTGITLPNSTAGVRLTAPNGDVVSETDSYSDPKDDQSWALINDVWQYTTVLTPGQKNQPTPTIQTSSIDDEQLADCGPGKFRNPETNRCKSITSGDVELKPCLPGQVRNPETNRCKSTVSTASNLTPCKPGQVRNPETNRCKSIASTASATLKPCAPGQERNPETNRCRKVQTLGDSTLASVNDVNSPTESSSFGNPAVISVVALSAVGYGAYEWRHEIVKAFSGVKSKLVR